MQNTELDSSLNPDNALALIFLKEAKFTRGLNKISHIGLMAKLRATTTATAFLKISFKKTRVCYEFNLYYHSVEEEEEEEERVPLISDHLHGP